jgi:hypothetical protein
VRVPAAYVLGCKDKLDLASMDSEVSAADSNVVLRAALRVGSGRARREEAGGWLHCGEDI